MLISWLCACDVVIDALILIKIIHPGYKSADVKTVRGHVKMIIILS